MNRPPQRAACGAFPHGIVEALILFEQLRKLFGDERRERRSRFIVSSLSLSAICRFFLTIIHPICEAQRLHTQ